MKAGKKFQVIVCFIITMVTTQMQLPTEVKANISCESCVAEKGEGGFGGWEYHIIDLSGAVTEYVYNHKGLLVEETNPLGEVTKYMYDSADRLWKVLTPDGTVTEYSYTGEGRVKEIVARKATGEEEALQYRYTPEGYLAAAVSESTEDVYTYTENGRVASVTRNSRFRLELSYDAEDNLAQLKETVIGTETEELVTSYAYDDCDRLTGVWQDGVLLAEYRYDEEGRLKQQEDGAGNVTEYVYDNQRKLLTMETRTGNGLVLYREENSYDEKGSVIARVVTGMAPKAGGTAGCFYFTYDKEDRLIREQGNYGTITYTYDVMGNRLTKTQNGVTTQYTYDLCNKLLTESTNGQRISYCYDAMGNLIKKTGAQGTTTYTYDAFNQLKQVINPQGVCQQNEYDAMGIRAVLVENGNVTNYVTYNGIVLAGYNSMGERTEHYTYGNNILTQR